MSPGALTTPCRTGFKAGITNSGFLPRGLPCGILPPRRNAATRHATRQQVAPVAAALNSGGAPRVPRQEGLPRSADRDLWRTAAATQAARTSEEDAEECEVVNGREVVIKEGSTGPAGSRPEERVSGYLVQPLKNSNGTGVLLLPDILGHDNRETREVAHRLACFGYTVLVADLFRGVPWSSERPQSEYEAWREKNAGPAERVTADIAEASHFLTSHLHQVQMENGVMPGQGGEPRLALLGFCFGGGRLLEALAKDGASGSGRYSAGVCFYGTRFDPEAVGAGIRVPVLMITGDEDQLCPVGLLQKVAALAQNAEVRVYPGRGHAFAHRPASMEEDDDAEDAFQAARHWLHMNLLPGHMQHEAAAAAAALQ